MHEELGIVMFKLGGNNMASMDYPRRDWTDGQKKGFRTAYRELHFDERIWREATERMARLGLNAALIDIHEGLIYPSHPELAVKGSWTPEKLQSELKRLRDMGITPFPKLNFSTSHSAWQKEWRCQTSTPEYYRFCSDVIADVAEIFGSPRLFHIGMDEEMPVAQDRDGLMIVRQGDLWWHDLKALAAAVERSGCRPWIWADKQWHVQDEFAEKCPKSIMCSNWAYGNDFSERKTKPDLSVAKKGRWWPHELDVHGYLALERYGYEQIPTGSNYKCNDNMALTVRFCREHIAPERLKGFMVASWKRCIPEEREALLASIDQLAAALK